jgi:chromosome segregation ATPase
VERVDEQSSSHESKVEEANNHIEVLHKKIEEKEKKIAELKEQMNNNDPKRKKCVEQILNAKKRINENTLKIVNKFL